MVMFSEAVCRRLFQLPIETAGKKCSESVPVFFCGVKYFVFYV